ncbi:hypothetical protein NUW58_g1596 [Xylaria curta]|uniref:Uncharacterized protein n=1 Tax=Xylaria curta TaxID=42375 RepID=A0ACC1PLJ3_9PEZI|nr:hypothetical protein NUW58_g1596 [Xylaria curta]
MVSNDQGSKKSFLRGFPSLAAFIASDVDKSTLIFNRFDRLAARNLLYMQEELAELQAELEVFDVEDSQDTESKKAGRNLNEFKKKSPRRVELLREIRDKMKEYREALLAESHIAALPHPDKRTFKAFRGELFKWDRDFDRSLCIIGGRSKLLYDNSEELVTLRASEQQDKLSLFVEDYLGYFFREDPKNDTIKLYHASYVSGRSIATFVSYFSTLLAIALLVGAILVLYNVESPNQKLGFIALFTVLFAASVGLLTNARRAEVYGATAAYAAVLVVFVSGNIGGAMAS